MRKQILCAVPECFKDFFFSSMASVGAMGKCRVCVRRCTCVVLLFYFPLHPDVHTARSRWLGCPLYWRALHTQTQTKQHGHVFLPLRGKINSPHQGSLRLSTSRLTLSSPSLSCWLDLFSLAAFIRTTAEWITVATEHWSGEEVGWVDVATVIEEATTRQIIEWGKKSGSVWKAGQRVRARKERRGGKTITTGEGLGIDRAIRKSIQDKAESKMLPDFSRHRQSRAAGMNKKPHKEGRS